MWVLERPSVSSASGEKLTGAGDVFASAATTAAPAYDREIVALGRGLYYATCAARPTQAMAAARQALLGALAAADRSRR